MVVYCSKCGGKARLEDDGRGGFVAVCNNRNCR